MVKKYNICQNCKTDFRVADWNSHRKYCSMKCYREVQRSDLNIQIIIHEHVCEYCKKGFKSRQKNRKYCCKHCFQQDSYSTMVDSLRKNKIEKICQTCGSTFEVHEYRKETAKFCSLQCAYKNGYNISKFSTNVFDFLDSYYDDIIREKMVVIGSKKYFPDILINGNIIVECYGDYWHCNPDMYESDFLNKHKNKSAKDIWRMDDIREQQLKNDGFYFFKIWENDWDNKDIKHDIISIINNFVENGFGHTGIK